MSLTGLPLFPQSAFPSKARGSAVAPHILNSGANYSNAFATPVSERRLVHVSASPGRVVLDEAPPFRGERFLTDRATGRSASRVDCDHLSDTSDLRARCLSRRMKASYGRLVTGLFFIPQALQGRVGDLSECPKQVSESPFVLFQTSNNGEFLCALTQSNRGLRRSA